jgi:hypothetical protein
MTSQDRCSFCGKDRDRVAKLVAGQKIAGQQVFICDECVSLLATPGDEYIPARDPTRIWPPLGGGRA